MTDSMRAVEDINGFKIILCNVCTQRFFKKIHKDSFKKNFQFTTVASHCNCKYQLEEVVVTTRECDALNVFPCSGEILLTEGRHGDRDTIRLLIGALFP